MPRVPAKALRYPEKRLVTTHSRYYQHREVLGFIVSHMEGLWPAADLGPLTDLLVTMPEERGAVSSSINVPNALDLCLIALGAGHMAGISFSQISQWLNLWSIHHLPSSIQPTLPSPRPAE